MAEAREAVTETLSGIRVVQSFNAEKHEARRYGNLLKKISTLKIRQGTAKAACLVAERVSLITLSLGGTFACLCFVYVASCPCS